MIKRGANPVSTITGNGVYSVNAGGYAYIRLHLTAISTGSIVVNASGTPALFFTETQPLGRNTYGASSYWIGCGQLSD
jgi:hypothetical protein